VPEGAEDQCRLIWEHIVACLRSAGMGVADLVKVTTFLSSRDIAPVNTTVIFDSRWKLEIEAVAAAPAHET
jgi:2-iminobutanoate/2-iminopropanoate deaminase